MFLERVAEGSIEAVIDPEVLQEILHRYRALGRWAQRRQVYITVRMLFPASMPITDEVVDRARQLLDEYSGLMARKCAAWRGGFDSFARFDLQFRRGV